MGPEVVERRSRVDQPVLEHEGSEAAVENATLDADLSFDPINTSGAAAYPITSPTWIIAYANQSSNEVGTNLKNYLTYIYGAGQGLAKDAGYAPLPPSYVQKAQAQVGKLQIRRFDREHTETLFEADLSLLLPEPVPAPAWAERW